MARKITFKSYSINELVSIPEAAQRAQAELDALIAAGQTTGIVALVLSAQFTDAGYYLRPEAFPMAYPDLVQPAPVTATLIPPAPATPAAPPALEDLEPEVETVVPIATPTTTLADKVAAAVDAPEEVVNVSTEDPAAALDAELEAAEQVPAQKVVAVTIAPPAPEHEMDLGTPGGEGDDAPFELD